MLRLSHGWPHGADSGRCNARLLTSAEICPAGAGAAIPFSHRAHLAKGLECKTCHPVPEPGDFATIPETSTCMSCHRTVKKERRHPAPRRTSRAEQAGRVAARLSAAGLRLLQSQGTHYQGRSDVRKLSWSGARAGCAAERKRYFDGRLHGLPSNAASLACLQFLSRPEVVRHHFFGFSSASRIGLSIPISSAPL
jgi:hypothetical protein